MQLPRVNWGWYYIKPLYILDHLKKFEEKQFAEENDEMIRRSIDKGIRQSIKRITSEKIWEQVSNWKGTLYFHWSQSHSNIQYEVEYKRIDDYDICDFIVSPSSPDRSQYRLRDSIFLPKYTRHRTTILKIAIFVDN